MRATLIAPLYLSISWVLTVSYQLFTDTAVRTLATNIALTWPNAGSWLNDNVSIIVFIYAFTWIFVLSSVLPSVILGKQRSIIVQYIFVLTLTLIAFYISDLLQLFFTIKIQDILQAANILTSPILAIIYLVIPYIFMIGLDYRSRRQLNKAVKNDTPIVGND